MTPLILNMHAGHNYYVPGASGEFSETKEARNVKNKAIALLRAEGHTVYDCTDEDGKTSSQNLANIVKKCNEHVVDLDVSIHFNAFNKEAHGTEVLQYSSKTDVVSTRICKNISALGYTNRGVKDGSHLYVVRKTNSKALLIECCFCDNKGDAKLYDADEMAKAIVEAILNEAIKTPVKETVTPKFYRVRTTWNDADSQIGAFVDLDNAKAECREGYTVFDWNGKAIYSNVKEEEVKVDKLYRIRKSWEDVKSQLGAYSDFENAKKNCPSGYSVFDWDGKSVYKNIQSTSSEVNSKLYRIRTSWDNAKSQIGAYADLENAKKECKEGYTVFDWDGKAVYTIEIKEEKPDILEDPEEPVEKPVAPEPQDISPLKGLDHDTFIEYIGSLAKADMKKTGVLASVTIAQAILESAWGQSELSLKANNLFGMKAKLSGNTWDSEWDGKIYAKWSPEERNGVTKDEYSDFRAYNSPAQSIKDHSDYLCGAMNCSKLRYEGLKGETDYKKAIQIIKDGGYATDSGYVNKVIDIIEKYDLDIWDMAASPSELEDIRNDIDEINSILSSILQFLEGVFNLAKKLFNK